MQQKWHILAALQERFGNILSTTASVKFLVLLNTLTLNRTEKKCYLQVQQLRFIVKDSQGQVVQLHFRQVPNDRVPMHECCTEHK